MLHVFPGLAHITDEGLLLCPLSVRWGLYCERAQMFSLTHSAKDRELEPQEASESFGRLGFGIPSITGLASSLRQAQQITVWLLC